MAQPVMNWNEVHIICPAAFVDEVSGLLQHHGADAITYHDAGDQPIYEPLPGENTTFWHATEIVGLFEETVSLQALLPILQKQESLGLIQQFQIKFIPNQDWVRLNLESFKPVNIGKRLCICPSWLTPPDPQRVVVTLDPGLAFGTGSHPTTALCLAWLDEHIRSDTLVMDYGCGSGILSIAAIKLGAQKAIAIDYDPQALLATQENATRNHVIAQIETYLPENCPELSVDCLVANILSQPLLTLANTFSRLIKPGGTLALSGILSSQAHEIIEYYENAFTLDPVIEREGWVLISGQRKKK